MSSMDDLYQSVIIEHDRNPRNHRVLDHPSHHAAGKNTLCGDEVLIGLQVNGDGKITDVAFQGQGCAISRASASMMTVALQGKSESEARALFEQFHGLMTGAGGSRNELGKLVAFGGVAAYPMRVKCATLAWHAMLEALNGTGHQTPP